MKFSLLRMCGTSAETFLSKKLANNSFTGFDAVYKDFFLIKAEDGIIKGKILVKKEHSNLHGVAHGGFLSTLIDVSTQFALKTCILHRECSTFSANLNVSFISKANVGVELDIAASVLKIGKSIAFAEGVLTNLSNGEIVATGAHTIYIKDSSQK